MSPNFYKKLFCAFLWMILKLNGNVDPEERVGVGKVIKQLSPRSSQQLIMISPEARHLNLFMFRFKTLVILLSCQMLMCENVKLEKSIHGQQTIPGQIRKKSVILHQG